MTSQYVTFNTEKNLISMPKNYDSVISSVELPDLIKSMTNPIGIEIGSDVGESAFYLLNSRPDLFLYCVDPFISYIDWNGNVMNSVNREETLQTFLAKMKPFEGRYKLIRMTSDDAVNQFEDSSVDFVFIDGLHEYEQVLKDCKNYWPKLKSSGLFSGHDYQVISGVRRAVDEFAETKQKKISTAQNDVWYYYK